MEEKKIKAQRVVEYYMLCNKLKEVIRTGWKSWNANRERLESVADHIFGTQMIAIAMYSEFEEYKNINISKVIMMLAIHELEEIDIGDKTPFQLSDAERNQIGHMAVNEILKDLIAGEEIKELILEFDERKTPEAKYAHSCDKSEWDWQSTIYDNEGCVDVRIRDDKDQKIMNHYLVKKLLDEGKSFSEICILYSQNNYNYDENFMAVSNYVLEHNAKKLVRSKETENK